MLFVQNCENAYIVCVVCVYLFIYIIHIHIPVDTHLLMFFMSRSLAPLRLVEDLNNASNLSALLEEPVAPTALFSSVAKTTNTTTGKVDEYRYVLLLLLERMKIKVTTPRSSSIITTLLVNHKNDDNAEKLVE